MAKDELIGGSLWEQYSTKVGNRMDNPRYMGEITEEEAKQRGARLVVVDHGADACGDAVRLFWLIDPENDTIIDSRFKTFGCGTAIAASDMMAEMCIGKSVEEASKINNLDVEQALRDDPSTPAVPPQKMHCSVMAYDAIKKATALYKGVDVQSLEDQDIVCDCAQVSLKTVKEVIKINDLHTIEEITNYTKAGAFCKSCIRPGGHESKKYYLCDILTETRQEMEKEQIKKDMLCVDFEKMNIVAKLKAVQKILDESISPMLAADGGAVEVADLRDQDNQVTLYLQYKGACVGCPSGQTATLQGISQILEKNLNYRLSVKIV